MLAVQHALLPLYIFKFIYILGRYFFCFRYYIFWSLEWTGSETSFWWWNCKGTIQFIHLIHLIDSPDRLKILTRIPISFRCFIIAQIKADEKYYMTQIWYMHINEGWSYHYLCFMKVNTVHRQLFGILKKFQVSLSWSHRPLIEKNFKLFQCHSGNIYNNNIWILIVLYIDIYICQYVCR